MEKDSRSTIQNKIERHPKQRTVIRAEDQLHRVGIPFFMI